MNNQELEKRFNENIGFNPVKAFKKEWIETGISEQAISYSSKFGFYLCNYEKFKDGKINNRPGRRALTNSQIRNVFGEVKRIQMKISGNDDKWNQVKSSFLLLQPKLAYATGRVESKTRGATLVDLKDVLFEAAKAVSADSDRAVDRYMNFVDFLESILAYHKAYGGKDN